MPGPDLFTVDWLYRQNHNENNDAEISGMQLNINAIQTATNIPECMTVPKLQQAIFQDQNLQHLRRLYHAQLAGEQR